MFARSLRSVSLLPLLGVVLLAGCASSRARTSADVIVQPGFTGEAYGTIVAEHQQRPAAGSDQGVRSAILSALGEPPHGDSVNGMRETEFIVREQDGHTISVVQDDRSKLAPGKLTPGMRVRIMHGAETEILPAG